MQANRAFGHLAFNYRPGEGPLTVRFFEALGCRVEDSGPVNEDGHLYTVLIEPETASFVDNIFYLSPVRPEQWAFEQRLAERLSLGSAREDECFSAFRALKAHEPEMFFHAALRYASLEKLESAILALEDLAATKSAAKGRISVVRFLPRSTIDPQINARIAASPIFKPGDRPSFGDFAVQVFVHTDLFAGELLSFGQTIELDYVFPRQLQAA